MDTAAVLAVAAATGLVVLLAAWISLPLWRGGAPVLPPDPRAVALLAEREAVLATLRDLDADLAAGRITAEEHAPLRARAVQRGVVTLAALDRLEADYAGQAARLAAAIEADVVAARQAEARPAPAGGAGAPGRSTGACGRCGGSLGPADPACGRCGQPVGGTVA
jgi:hypothetical protein